MLSVDAEWEEHLSTCSLYTPTSEWAHIEMCRYKHRIYQADPCTAVQVAPEIVLWCFCVSSLAKNMSRLNCWKIKEYDAEPSCQVILNKLTIIPHPNMWISQMSRSVGLPSQKPVDFRHLINKCFFFFFATGALWLFVTLHSYGSK